LKEKRYLNCEPDKDWKRRALSYIRTRKSKWAHSIRELAFQFWPNPNDMKLTVGHVNLIGNKVMHHNNSNQAVLTETEAYFIKLTLAMWKKGEKLDSKYPFSKKNLQIQDSEEVVDLDKFLNENPPNNSANNENSLMLENQQTAAENSTIEILDEEEHQT